MPKAKQLSVRVENRPGTLAHVARVLGDAKVNILAFLTSRRAPQRPRRAGELCREAGRQGDQHYVRIPDDRERL